MQWTFYKQSYVQQRKKSWQGSYCMVVDVVSHLILQVYMAPTGEEKL